MNAFTAIAQSLTARPVVAPLRFEVPDSKGGCKPSIVAGTRFGRWTVIGYVPGNRTDGANVRPRYTCKCERDLFIGAVDRACEEAAESIDSCIASALSTAHAETGLAFQRAKEQAVVRWLRTDNVARARA